ncbi:MAG: insulinase family protein [Chitinophagales bacterium]|nr:insulinase family protein [Chitinophagales bacterium]
MIQVSKKILKNGLTVVHHLDENTPFVVVNVLYKVGAKDEDPERTGFAHLFEHLMFEGSKHAKSYDQPLQEAGGENNAFTNNDYTNYYSQVPANNIDISLFLEADRMAFLNINQRSLNVQKKVVVEEFKENYINQPYGDVWHLLREMVYEKHPYKWPTIGLRTEHISEAVLEEVRNFFSMHYQPQNAILVIGGNIEEAVAFEKAEQYFGWIEPQTVTEKKEVIEPEQTVAKTKTVYADVPLNGLYIAFKSTDRYDDDFYVSDLISDILSGGQSSRLYQRLVKEQKLFVSIDAYISASNEIGMFVVEGKINEDVPVSVAEAAVWQEIELLKTELTEKEIRKTKNKILSYLNFSDTSIMGRTINIAYYEMLGDANGINQEESKYESVTLEKIQRFCNKYLTHSKSNTLYYLRKQHDQAN